MTRINEMRCLCLGESLHRDVGGTISAQAEVADENISAIKEQLVLVEKRQDHQNIADEKVGQQVIFWLPEGPKLSWDGETLHVEDLNPEVHIKWRIDALLLRKIGAACLGLAHRVLSDA